MSITKPSFNELPAFAEVAKSGSFADLMDQPFIPSNITDLSDILITSVQNGQSLIWDNTSSKFINGTPSQVNADWNSSSGSSQILNKPNISVQSGAIVITDAVSITPTALSSSSNAVAVDFSLSNNFTLSMTENTTLSNPTNIVTGQTGVIIITQNASASKTLAFGNYWKYYNGTTPSISTTLSAVNLLVYAVVNSNSIFYNLIKNGVA